MARISAFFVLSLLLCISMEAFKEGPSVMGDCLFSYTGTKKQRFVETLFYILSETKRPDHVW